MGSLGFGAGILSINGMVYMPGLRMSQLEAVANSVAAQCVSANAAGGQWLRSGYCDLTVAACLGICGLPGAALGAQLARELSDATLRLLSAGMMCLVLCPLALSQLYTSRTQPSAPRAAIGDGDPEGRGDEESATFQGKKFPSGGCPAERPPAPCASSGGDPRDRGAEGSGASRGKTRPGGHGLAESQAILLHCAVGGAVGVVTSTIGIGDTPLLMAYLSSLGLRQRTVIGTVTVAQAPTLACSALLHMLAGHSVPSVGVAVAAGMSLGASCGARVSAYSRVDDTVLQMAFAAFVFAVGGATVWATCTAQ